MRTLRGVDGLLGQGYKGVLLDQFGVLHDGRDAYPGAPAAVQRLAEAGFKLLVLSNSSRRSAGALANLAQKGFDPAHFAGAITSGEVTHSQLSQRPGEFWGSLGRRCLHLTWGDRGAISLEGLGLEVVAEPEHADFILAHGTEAVGRGDGAPPVPASIDAMASLLQRCAECGGQRGARVPMIVANPDLVTVHGAELRVMPGTLARMYADMGGEVHLMGKPAPIIYERAMDMLGLAPEEVVAIGDSLEHDIAGAAGAGVASAFVCGGIHKERAFTPGTIEPDDAGLAGLCEEYGTMPTYVMPYFV